MWLWLWLLGGFWGRRGRVVEEGDRRLARGVGNGFTFGRETLLEGGRVAAIIRIISFRAPVDVFRRDIELDLGWAVKALQRLLGLPLALGGQGVGILRFARSLGFGLYSGGLGNGILGFAALGKQLVTGSAKKNKKGA